MVCRVAQSAGLHVTPLALTHSHSPPPPPPLFFDHGQELPHGPFLDHLRQVHLGTNRLLSFPSALLAAPELQEVNLAHQSATPSGAACGSSSAGSPASSPSMSRAGSGVVPVAVALGSAAAAGGRGMTQRMILTESGALLF